MQQAENHRSGLGKQFSKIVMRKRQGEHRNQLSWPTFSSNLPQKADDSVAVEWHIMSYDYQNWSRVTLHKQATRNIFFFF